MNNEVFTNISKIIGRDSKTTTYKFALLRGVIDIIQENSPFILFSNNRVHLPMGLLVEKWLLYYYPILESQISIPQINGEARLAFETQFLKIISIYRNIDGFSAFYNDLKNKGIPQNIQSDFIDLSKVIQKTITEMPMKYIGRSISNEYYSIFKKENKTEIIRKNLENIDLDFLVQNFGTFSIPVDYYEVFKFLGSFITGKDSILFKWAEFSINASRSRLSIEKVVNEVLKNPVTDREIKESKKIYEDILSREGKVFCVWSGDEITSCDIDHMIPFSIWKNNDLWNLLPTKPKVNNLKKDKIPSIRLIENKKDLIINYWNILYNSNTQRFQKEIKISLLGNFSLENWQENAIEQLKKTCDYLINIRGFEVWDGHVKS